MMSEQRITVKGDLGSAQISAKTNDGNPDTWISGNYVTDYVVLPPVPEPAPLPCPKTATMSAIVRWVENTEALTQHLRDGLADLEKIQASIKQILQPQKRKAKKRR